MKANLKMIALALASGLLFAGCGTVEWDTQPATPYSAASSQEPDEDEPTEPPHREETGTEPVIEGEHTVLLSALSSGRELVDVTQSDTMLVLQWNSGALETIDPATGESVGQDPAAVPELPESLRSRVWQAYPAGLGLPYDMPPGSSTVIYTGEDGIYLAGLDGVNPSKVLDNASIPDWLGYWGMTGQLPEHDNSQLHYIAPLIMDGGKQVAATAYFVGDEAYDSHCLGIVAVEIETNQITYFPDPIERGRDPARRLSPDLLAAKGETGDIRITLSTGESKLIPLSDGESATYDGHTLATLDPLVYDDGYQEFTLLLASAETPEGVEKLKIGGYPNARIMAMTGDYMVVKVGDAAGNNRYLAVKYSK
jgi:hypothetical protein